MMIIRMIKINDLKHGLLSCVPTTSINAKFHNID